MKAKIGFYCTRCNHKVADRCVDSRTEKSGVCSKCHNEYYGTIGFQLPAGQIKAHFETRETRDPEILRLVLTA
jgi:formate-dependent nitrite reductase cytochrome c552 subunit